MTYDIFISYKRGGSSSATAAYLYDMLTKKGFSVFFDRKEIRQGQFNTQLLGHIENATDIIILLDGHSLKACFSDIRDTYKTDWFCMEVMHSLLKQKRIIPLLLDGYLMPEADKLPEEMKALSLQNAISLDIADIEAFYKKYLIEQGYLASKPRNIYLSQTKGEGVADFLFYSDGECDLFECGNLIGTLNNNNDEDHPYRHPVQRCGEHRFYCRNNDTFEEQRIIESIDVNSQKYINIKWSSTQNLWELTEEDIQRQEDSRILFRWGKGLFEGTSKHDPNTKLSFLCLKESANKWNIDARNYIVDHVKGLFSTELALDDRIAWYEKAIEFDSADAYEILGRYYDEGIEVKQDINKALEYGQKALKLRIEKYGEMNADVAMSYHNLGRAYDAKSDPNEALCHYEKALQIRNSIYDGAHPELAKTLNNLANVYKVLNRDQEALNTYQKAIEMKKELYGEKHKSLAVTYLNLGSLSEDMGNFEKALEYNKKALEIQEMELGTQHPDMSYTYLNLGSICENNGDFDKAQEYFQKALEIRKNAFGEKHIVIANSYIALGDLYKDKGEYDKALIYLNKALEVQKEILGEYHPDIAETYSSLGSIFYDKGDSVKTKESNQKAIGLYKQILKNQPNNKGIYNQFAWSLQMIGNYEEALPWAEKAVEAFPNNPQVLDTLASIYQGLKKYEEAMAQFRICLKKYKEKNNKNGIKKTTEKIKQLKAIMS